MPANFPNSPTDGQSYTFGGTTYVYSSTNASWKAFIGVGQMLAIQVFTASGTYTPTTGMEWCVAECVGSGAGGGGTAQSTGATCGSGGGGGSYARKLLTAATIGTSQAVTVGNAGTGGTAGANNGTNGSDCSLGTLCVGKGGSLGNGAPANNPSGGGAGGAGGVAGTGDFTVPGGGGGGGQGGSITTYLVQIGNGGNSGLGFGMGGKAVFNAAGTAGSLYGSGGGGGGSYNNSAAQAGGDGAKGIVIVTEFTRSSPVPGVSSSTDNAIVRFDGTAGRCQDSPNATIDDNGAMVLESDSAGAQGPSLVFSHNSASPANSDIVGQLVFTGRDSGAASQTYGYMLGYILDPVAGTEDGQISFNITTNGADVRVLNLTGTTVDIPLGQISFPAAQNPSANANTLDDYEEGTFSPTFTANASSTGVTYNAQVGNYTKIGNTIRVYVYLKLTSNGTGVGQAAIASLPFTNSLSTGHPLATWLVAGGSAASGIKAVVNSSGSTANFIINGAASDAAATDTNCTDTFEVVVRGTYI